MKTNYPTISIIIPTFNSQKTIEKCLSGIRKQDYPKSRIEVLIVDGGSKDSTLKIASKFHVHVIKIDPREQNVEWNKNIGIHKAKGELLLMIDHDNILPNKNILKKMVQPFLEHKDMVGVETLRYYYDKKATLLDRYFALFGVTDPLAYYFGKADRMSYIYNTYAKKYHPIDCGDYFLVRFKEDDIPTIGANGFLVRKNTLLRHANVKPGMYFHIDVNVDLVRKGFNTYAFIKDSILHLSGHGDIIYYLKRKMLFVKQYNLSEDSMPEKNARRYSLYEKRDFWKLVYFISISLTVIVPLIDSIRGYRKIHDVAWFLNPILCIGFVVIYGYVVIEYWAKKIMNKVFSAR